MAGHRFRGDARGRGYEGATVDGRCGGERCHSLCQLNAVLPRCASATSTLTEGVVMAFSMAAMMAASAVPFFFAYGRDSRRPVTTATVVLMYVSIWALIGFTLNYMMGMVMMASSFLIAAGAFAMAVVYAHTPWGRWARNPCRGMARRQPRKSRFRHA